MPAVLRPGGVDKRGKGQREEARNDTRAKQLLSLSLVAVNKDLEVTFRTLQADHLAHAYRRSNLDEVRTTFCPPPASSPTSKTHRRQACSRSKCRLEPELPKHEVD